MGHSLLDGKPTVAQFGASVLQLNITSSRWDSETDAASDQVGSLQASGSVIRLFASGSDLEQSSVQAGLTGSLYFLKPSTDNLELSKPARILGHNLDETVSGDWTFSGDVTLNGGDGALTFGSAGSVKIPDNSATALVIEEADAAYMTFATSNGSETVTANKNFAAAGTLAVTGLSNLDGGIEIDNGGNKFTVSNAGVVVAAGSLTADEFATDGSEFTVGTDGAVATTSGYTVGSTVITDDSIVMTPSSGDTLSITSTTNGASTIATADGTGTDADLALTADGQITYRANDAAGHIFDIAGTSQVQLVDGVLKPTTTNDVDLGTNSLLFKSIYAHDVRLNGSLSASYIAVDHLDVNTINSVTKTVNTLEVADKYIVLASGSTGGNVNGAGIAFGGHGSPDGMEGPTAAAGTLSWDSELNGVVVSGSTAASAAHLSASGDVYGNDGHFVGRLTVKNDGNIGSDGAYDAMTISSAGIVTFKDDIKIKDGGTIGNATSADAMTLAANGIVTFKDDILIKDGGTIGNATSADAMTLAADGIVTFKDDIKIKDGGTIGNATVADVMTLASTGIVTFKDDILIKSAGTIGTADVAASLTWNGDGDLTFSDGAYDYDIASHDGTNGLKLGGTLVTSDAGELNLLDGSSANSVVNNKAVIYSSGGNVNASSMTVADGGTIGSVSDTAAITIAAGGACTFSDSAVFDGGATFNAVTTVANGNTFSALGNTTLGNATSDVVGIMAQVTASTGLSVASGQDVYFVGGNGARLVDNSSNALDFREGDNSYLKFVTTNSSESIEVGVDLNLAEGANVTADAFVLNSDETLKKDIKNLDSALDKVMSMRGVTYQFKHNPEKQEIGFLAQEMKNSVPEVVSTTNQGTLGIDYAKLTSVLVEAVKEQQEQIEELKAKLSKDNS